MVKKILSFFQSKQLKLHSDLFAKYIQKYSKVLIALSFLGTVFVYLTVDYLIPQMSLLQNSVSEGIVGTHTENDIPKVVKSLISQPLIKMDSQGNPAPNLVEKWDVNKEANLYIFKLKKDIFWTDGTKIKSSDIDIVIPDATTTYPDDETIEIKLADSYSPLPSLLTSPVLKKNSLTGTGPYKITSIDKNKLNQVFISKIILEAKNNELPKVTVKFYPSEKIAKQALRIGDVQAVLAVSDIEDFKGENPYSTRSFNNFLRLVAIFYNTKDPVLSDRNMRLALSFAAPSISGETEAKTSIPPVSWAFNPNVRDFLDNSEQAKTYLEKVKKGKDSIITLTSTGPLQKVGERIVNSWKEQGINAVLRTESGIPQNFQALLITQDIPADPDQYTFWHSTQTQTNISQYFSENQYSPRVDKDLEDGRKTVDLEVRKARYHDLQKVLADDAPATFLYFPKLNVLYLERVEERLEKVLSLQFIDFKT